MGIDNHRDGNLSNKNSFEESSQEERASPGGSGRGGGGFHIIANDNDDDIDAYDVADRSGEDDE